MPHPEWLIPRTCGDCTACCSRLPIPAGIVGPVAKPAGTPCPHLCSGGCAIYALRPQICADFRCAWLQNDTWPADWRPDISGMLCLREALAEDMPAALVYELREGALAEPAAATVLAELVESNALVVVVDAQEHRHVMPGNALPETSTSHEPVAIHHAT